MSRLGLSRTLLVDESVVEDALAALAASERARETEGIAVRARAARSASERAVAASMMRWDVRRGGAGGRRRATGRVEDEGERFEEI